MLQKWRIMRVSGEGELGVLGSLETGKVSKKTGMGQPANYPKTSC
jgi:hypothetical protein